MPDNLITPEFWNNNLSAPPQGEERQRRLAAILAELACSNDSAPYIARGLLHERIKSVGTQVASVAEKLRKGKFDQSACPGVNGFNDEDWENLDLLVPPAPNTESETKTE